MITRIVRGLWLLGAVTLLTLVSTTFVQTPASAGEPVDLESDYVVVLKPGPGAAGKAGQLSQAHGARHVYKSVFDGFCASLSPNAADALKNNPNVESVEAVFTMQATAETLPTGVDRIDAEKAHTAGAFGAGANVAVVDTGIDLDHPDLAANVNTALSRTFVSHGNTTVGGDDDNGHGSHVAGTIAAVRGNGIGAVGVAPGATLISLKVLNRQGSGSTGDIIAALDYITTHNNTAASYAECIHVANCSFGGSGGDTNSAYRQAFQACVASGCFIAVAAGNEGSNTANYVPAAYDAVFTVSAMNPVTGAFASFSNYGADVDMAAPGVSIYSTYKNGGYSTLNGTSMASPHVAGTAALYVAQNAAGMSRATAESQVRQALLAAAENVNLPGDPDAFDEPLADAEALVGPVAPAVDVAISKDKSVYSMSDVSALLTVTVRDEHGAGIAGLGSSQFDIASLPAGVSTLSFTEISGGVYQVSVDISTFAADTDYLVTVTVTDTRPIVGDKTVTIRRSDTPPPPPAAIYVAAIGYRVQGPNLFVDVTIGATLPSINVSGVNVAITLNRNGSPIGSAAALTDSTGKVSFRLRNAPSGNYTTTVTGVSKAGLSYDPQLNVTDPGYTK